MLPKIKGCKIKANEVYIYGLTKDNKLNIVA